MKNERYFAREGEICKDLRSLTSVRVANGRRLVFYMRVHFQIKCLARFALN